MIFLKKLGILFAMHFKNEIHHDVITLTTILYLFTYNI